MPSMSDQRPSENDTNIKPIVDQDNALKMPSGVELKAGKLVFKQKAMDWASGMAYMKSLVALNEYLEGQESPIDSIPEEHLNVIARLVHESDKSLSILCKHIKKTLVPPIADDESHTRTSLDAVLTNEAIESAVLGVAERRNYGIDDGPASLCIWRWEARNLLMIQDAPAKKVAIQRLEQRLQAKTDVLSLFDTLTLEERQSLVKRKKEAEPRLPKALKVEAGASSTKPESKANVEPKVKAAYALTAKQVASQAKKAATQKSAAVMASFFSKAPAPLPVSVQPKADDSTEFDRYFRPFPLRKNTVLPSSNRFGHALKANGPQIIVLDADGDVEMIQEHSSKPDDGLLAKPPSCPSDMLHEFIEHIPASRRVRSSTYVSHADVAASKFASPRKSPSKQKGNSDPPLKIDSRISVRNVMAQLMEAEITGDERGTRSLQNLLKNRRKIPAKLLQFHDNARPAYYGTWTKTSSCIGPRTPFARDLVVFDYSYDSGDEWVEEEEGGEEIVSEVDSDGGNMSNDFEEDDWLVGDDDVEIADGVQSQGGRSRSSSPLISRTGEKRKAVGVSSGGMKTKRPRSDNTPLIPFVKGPCLESSIGERDYQPFSVFSIQLLNDAQFGLDPFSFVSNAEDEYRSWQKDKQTAGAGPSNPNPIAARPNADIFAVPNLPQHLAQGTSASFATQTSSPSPNNVSSKKAGPPFNIIPALYPEFLRAIEGSDRPKAVLADEIFKSFKERCAALRKGAVESKISEVAFKEKKVWRVKADVWTTAGLRSPSSETPIAS